MNTNNHTYHAQNDDIDIWCRYKITTEVQDDGQSSTDIEWIGELEITLAQGKLIRLTLDEASLVVRSLSKMFEKQQDDWIDHRIGYLEKDIEQDEFWKTYYEKMTTTNGKK